ncbi:site-specific DNA-methyltransferase [Candidatus Aerophobetes bacterium]|nr:site-specific DNA-methyltransferase [Candidatus Aerophobetes bacterium]
METRAKIIVGDSRKMEEVGDEIVDFIVTSPPYWHIKDYSIPGQIGYGQTLHEYLKDLYYVWRECYRVLRKGARLCINIGDQFARSIIYGRYKVIPIHAEFIAQCEQIGFDFMGSIIWQKKTTMNTTGGATVMGSFPYPPNGIVEIDYEFIHIFKKPGKGKRVSKETKEASRLTTEEWKTYFSGHWNFGGVKQIGHEAMFPDELPKRLIKMFTFIGDTVLDPFLGSGTTAQVALQLQRNAIGYEINEAFLDIVEEKMGMKGSFPQFFDNIEVVKRKHKLRELPKVEYVPGIQDAKPKIDPKKFKFKGDRLYRVVEVIGDGAIKLDTGLTVTFLGVKIEKKEDTIRYLEDYIVGKSVFLKFQDNKLLGENDTVSAYVYLKNKIFINSYLIKAGLALPDVSLKHTYKDKFIQL